AGRRALPRRRRRPAHPGPRRTARALARAGRRARPGRRPARRRAPVREQCVAAQGERVFAVFVEVHAGQ
ncbi:hypothetical protein XarbCFBP8150_21645, partial [Xanthomonas arboricola]